MPAEKTPAELKKRLEEIEKGHGKLMSINDELRIISMEYADIRSRIETADVLMDQIERQMEVESRMWRINMMLILIVILLTAVIMMKLAIGF